LKGDWGQKLRLNFAPFVPVSESVFQDQTVRPTSDILAGDRCAGWYSGLEIVKFQFGPQPDDGSQR